MTLGIRVRGFYKLIMDGARVSSTGSLYSYCWGDQCVVYHANSGDTHLLNKIDLTVLQYINNQPITLENLSLRTRHLLGDHAEQYIDCLLTSFGKLDLVEVVPSKPSN